MTPARDIDLVLVDGTNLANTVIRMLGEVAPTAPANDLREYFLKWWDIDRFVRATLTELHHPRLGIAIYHSGKKFGPDDVFTIAQTGEIDSFWKRQGLCAHSSCHRVVSQSKKEKGVDSSVITHLFESMSEWTTACIFSEDGDMVPAIESLRRRGNRIFVAARNASSDIVQAAQNRIDLPTQWLLRDFEIWRFFRRGELRSILAHLTSFYRDYDPALEFDHPSGPLTSNAFLHARLILRGCALDRSALNKEAADLLADSKFKCFANTDDMDDDDPKIIKLSIGLFAATAPEAVPGPHLNAEGIQRRWLSIQADLAI